MNIKTNKSNKICSASFKYFEFFVGKLPVNAVAGVDWVGGWGGGGGAAGRAAGAGVGRRVLDVVAGHVLLRLQLAVRSVALVVLEGNTTTTTTATAAAAAAKVVVEVWRGAVAVAVAGVAVAVAVLEYK